MMQTPNLTVSSSPHFHAKYDTASIMWTVSAALAPSALWGVWSFGLRALLVLVISIGTALLCEYIVNRVTKKETLWDGSAFLTGLLVGMNMSPQVPLFVPVIASFFAIIVVKWTFGGLGANWANPALAGRVFVFFSFTSSMSTFTLPRVLKAICKVDEISSATPLTYLKGRMVDGISSASVLTHGSYPVTDFAEKVGGALGVNRFAVDAFFGNVGGCIGEISTILLLAGVIFLICKKIISWQTPVLYLGTFTLLQWLFGGFAHGSGFAQGEILLPLFTGGLFLGAFFMATDYVTSPATHKGQMIFGAGCGFFTFLFRNFGSMPEAVSVSILLMNIVTPTIDRYVKNRKFGEVKPVKEAKA